MRIAVADHWKTTFVLMNAGDKSAQAHIRFFDDNGDPLTLPLNFPQGGSGISTSGIDCAIAAHASLLIESTGRIPIPCKWVPCKSQPMAR